MTTEQLEKLDACKPAIYWVSQQDSTQQAWQDCPRGDWMLWLLGKLSGPVGSESRKKLVLTVCECARLSLHLIPEGEDRPRMAIETAEKYVRGDDGVTLESLKAASAAASAADAAAADAAAAAAADAAAAAAVASASAAAADAASEKTLKKCADIVRKHYPDPPELTNDK